MQLHQISQSPEWNYCFNLMLDDSVSEIVSNGPGEFFMKKSGKRIKIDGIPFSSGKDYALEIARGLVPHVTTVDEYTPNSYLFEGPMEYKANGQKIKGRCHIVLSPAADYPQVTIAKKSTSLAQIEDIAARGSMGIEMLEFLKACVNANFTMVFSGGTGAGKTTMLESLTKLIPLDVRIGVAEDTPELVLTQPNVAYLHAVPWKPGMSANDVATLSWVVKQYQRMRTDRIIIGETRGKEFADFLIAANSGMEGSLTTIHADTPTRCLDKMTSFALQGFERQPIKSINKDIANAVDVIVQLIILPDGRHKIGSIQEITNTVGGGEDAAISTAPLYYYDEITDAFYKGSKPTDGLRNKFAKKGISVEKFLSVPEDTRLAMFQNEASTAPPKTVFGRGLPINPSGRRSL